MNYVDKSDKGYTDSRNKVKLYDIVQPRTGYWKNKLAIVTHINTETKLVNIRIIENGMDLVFRVKFLSFVNHNTKTAAKSYFELCEKMKIKFVAKYSDINYIKEHFDDDIMICNDIVASTICKGAGIYISNNPDIYNTKAVNWLADNMTLISAILRIPDIHILEASHKDGIIDCGMVNVIKLYKYFYGSEAD